MYRLHLGVVFLSVLGLIYVCFVFFIKAFFPYSKWENHTFNNNFKMFNDKLKLDHVPAQFGGCFFKC